MRMGRRSAGRERAVAACSGMTLFPFTGRDAQTGVKAGPGAAAIISAWLAVTCRALARRIERREISISSARDGLATRRLAGFGASSCAAAAWPCAICRPGRVPAYARGRPPMAWAGRSRQGMRAAGRECLDPDEAQQARTCVFLRRRGQGDGEAEVQTRMPADPEHTGRQPPAAAIMARWQAAGLSPLPLGQDPGPAASIRYRLSQPRRGITSVTGTSGRRDRADAHVLLR